MTDRERITEARWLLGEIVHALDCAVLGIDRAEKALRESGLVAAMLAAQAVIDVLGGSKESKP